MQTPVSLFYSVLVFTPLTYFFLQTRVLSLAPVLPPTTPQSCLMWTWSHPCCQLWSLTLDTCWGCQARSSVPARSTCPPPPLTSGNTTSSRWQPTPLPTPTSPIRYPAATGSTGRGATSPQRSSGRERREGRGWTPWRGGRGLVNMTVIWSHRVGQSGDILGQMALCGDPTRKLIRGDSEMISKTGPIKGYPWLDLFYCLCSAKELCQRKFIFEYYIFFYLFYQLLGCIIISNIANVIWN